MAGGPLYYRVQVVEQRAGRHVFAVVVLDQAAQRRSGGQCRQGGGLLAVESPEMDDGLDGAYSADLCQLGGVKADILTGFT